MTKQISPDSNNIQKKENENSGLCGEIVVTEAMIETVRNIVIENSTEGEFNPSDFAYADMIHALAPYFGQSIQPTPKETGLAQLIAELRH